MPNETVFAHLAGRFAASEENLATEALAFILARSDAAKRAFLDLIKETGVPLPENLALVTQAAAADRSVPDLVGHDGVSRPLIVEVKFWAGLTENQPVKYLEQLPEGTPGILLFLAPEARLPLLWSELQRRCLAAQVSWDEKSRPSRVLVAHVGGTRRLAAVSWRALLASLRRGLEDRQELNRLSDLAQLEGLCERMDREAFLPLRSEELTGDIGRRVVQFCNLVDAVAQQCFVSGIADGSGLRSVGGNGWYGRYMRLAGHVVLLHFSPWKWAHRAATPIWLDYYADQNTLPPSVLRGWLTALEMATPRRLFLSSKGDLEIPLFLEPGREHDDLVAGVFRQLEEVGALLATHGGPEMTSGAPTVGSG